MCTTLLVNEYISFNCLNLICLHHKLTFLSLDVKITFIFALYDKNSSHFLCLINPDYWNYLILTLYLLIPDWYGVYNSKRRYFNTTFYEEIHCRLVNTPVKILTHLSHSGLLGKKDVMHCQHTAKEYTKKEYFFSIFIEQWKNQYKNHD